ncbi:MAG: hypothetical protein OXD49_21055 [Candidatus Poribacteria bacterium]|nr:hypothetical protein [Candidatus Poribacteria bacterium]
MKPTFTLSLIALFGIFSSFLLLGCTSKHIKTEVSETRAEDGKNIRLSQEQSAKVKKPKEDLIIGFDPFKDDPDNPSSHNPLIKQFGDTPEVRTYIRLKQKLGRGIGLNIDEAIELYTAEVHLYRTPAAKEMLKDLKADKKRYERLGIPADGPILTDTPPKENLPPPDFVLVNPFTDDPDNPSPHNPLIRKFGDIPEVRTYIRLKQKFYSGIGFNIDEAIELYTTEAYLYPSDATKANLKRWKKDKERYERLGISMDGSVLRYTGETRYSNGRKTIIHPDGSKTIYDSRVEGGVIEIPSQAESPYTDDAIDEKN